MKATAAPILGTTGAISTAARAAGLAHVHTEERTVDVGVTEAAQLVRYRLGNAAFAAWLVTIGAERAAALAAQAENAVGDSMVPYQPRVVFLRALTSSRSLPRS
jgi:hypothetical protein